METREDDAVPIVGEQTTSLQNKVIHNQETSMINESISSQVVNSECNGTIKQNEVITNPQKIPNVYRQDVVRCNGSGMIGIVTGVAGDSDSDSSETDEDDDDEDGEASENEEDDNDCDGNANENDDKDKGGGNDKSIPLSPDQVQVLWMDDSEKTQNLNDVTVIDRGFLHGDYLASASDPTGQVGVVVDVNISVDLLSYDGSLTKDVSSRDLKRVRDFTSGDYVVLGPWLGRIDDVLDNVTVLFDDGSVCKVMKADPMNLKQVGKNVLEDGSFPYYPGQTVKASSSSVFKNGRWLTGLWKANRLEGTVTKVTVGSVFIYWIASAGYGPDSSTAPAEEQSPKNLKLLSCFSHANWQLGDWCLLPSVALSSMIPLEKDLSKLELHDSDQTESDSAKLSHGGDLEGIASKESIENEYVDHDSAAGLDGSNKNIEVNSSPESSPCTSSLAVSKEHVHETWPLHRKKIRKVVVRRDKKARRKEENFERALVIVNTRTRVDVAWQDGTTEHGVLSTTLIPIDNPGDHEFVAEQYVVEKASDDSDDACEVRRVGVVKSVNAKERTACVRWLKPVSRAEDPREFDDEEVVSVYELEGHPDYDYCYGDVVVRLSPVSVSTETAYHGEYVEETTQKTSADEVKPEVKKNLGCNKTEDASGDETCMGFSDLSWVGNITGLSNGDIEVTWADGMVSTVGPQAVYVVGRDDDDDSIAAGSVLSNDAASWETMDDDEVDAIENFNEEPTLQNNTNINRESEDSFEVGEDNSGRNGALSIPLAAFDFVARLATGIFSRGRKHLDPLPLDSRGENELQSQSSMNFLEKSASSDDSSSQKSNANDNSIAQNAQDEREEHVAAESTNLDMALCNLRSLEQEIPACYEDDACGFKRFDIARDPVDHHFLGSNGQKSNERKWLRKVQQDWSILQNNLPVGICVRVYEDRMDLLRAVIVGAYGTPYQDGLFFFDFHLPPEYPDVPPSAYYHSGGWRINPNLYEEGKVCLSLLNTWTGRGNEVWDPVSSSILQVLVSLQGLVLNSRPYFNEAGYDKQIGTAEGEKNSLSYNENTFLLNCKTMMFLMRRPPKDFEELVRDHFKRHGYYILKACDAYMKGYLIGSLAKDASISDNSNANSTSVGFKLMLAKIVPKLFLALNEVGADCNEFKHLQQS